jgi:hypothetical protein
MKLPSMLLLNRGSFTSGSRSMSFTISNRVDTISGTTRLHGPLAVVHLPELWDAVV